MRIASNWLPKLLVFIIKVPFSLLPGNHRQLGLFHISNNRGFLDTCGRSEFFDLSIVARALRVQYVAR